MIFVFTTIIGFIYAIIKSIVGKSSTAIVVLDIIIMFLCVLTKEALAIPFGIFICVILNAVIASAENDLEKLGTATERTKRQDKYDNEWGIIN